MGCVCGKEASSAAHDSDGSSKRRRLPRKTSELRVTRAVSVKREESVPLERLENADVRTGLIDKKVNGLRRVREDYREKERGNGEIVGNLREIGVVPRAVEGEQISAGWPSWLVAVAGEAIRGWIPRKADTFEKLEKIGQGTYSSVYMGRDLLNKKIVALKRVRFDSMDPESVKFMAREIVILRRLDHPNVIKLEALVTSRSSSSLYLVFEYMEHDLTGLASLPGAKFTEPQVKCYMHQLLKGLEYCHDNGVLHRDIKGSNLLIDNHGTLKIADFGLASYFDDRQRIPLTSRVVTLWYRPPELLLGATHYGVAVDLWSAGCILGELYTGKPIMPGRTEVEQLHKIFKLCGSPSEDYWNKSKLPHSTVFKPAQPYRKRIAETFKDLPDVTIRLMEMLLTVDPSDRGTADRALKSEYFRTEPLACEPSSLPKYPPSKEMNAKLREEEARRQGVTGYKGQKVENDSKRSKELRAAPAPDANAELATSMQRRQANSNPKSRSEYFNSQKEEAASGFPIDPPRSTTEGLRKARKDHRQSHPKRASYSGPLRQGTGLGRKRDEPTRNGLSTLSSLVATRGSSSLKSGDKLVSSAVDPLLETFGDPMSKHDRTHQSHIFSGSQQLEHGRVDVKEPLMDRQVPKEKRMNFSGPILVPSSNMEDVLKDHDRRIQDAARRRRHERTRGERVRAWEKLLASNPVHVPTAARLVDQSKVTETGSQM